MKLAMQWFSGLFMALCLGTTAQAQSIDYGYLDARIRLLMQRDDMMGLAVAVVENGDIRFVRGYGLTEEGGSPVNTDTRFRWASVSKGLAGTIAAELDHQGILSLDDTVSEYQTTLRLPGFGENTATLRDVLSHRLGLVSNAYDNILESGREPSTIRGMLGDLDLICPVGQCHGYQNVAFDTIEEVFYDTTGDDFDTIVSERVFRPLGMRNAASTYEGFVDGGNYARPYNYRGGRMVADRITPPYFRVAAAGGISSSADDMARYLQAQMGLRPAVFSQEALTEAHTPIVETLREARGMGRRYDRIQDADYGLGWRIYDYEGHTVVGHRGAVRGYRALIMFDPERQTGIAAMWNSNISRPTGLQFELMDMVYGLEHRDWMRLMSGDS
ncbi:serine hydrolase domain-containing protein [Ponticaulis koreensis]|uniref:serine hydrolase domain-containing protein n=1 Tax=Ponticaulis koreensis TaxID=1123045 RepID=UPI0003B4D3A5|nr:serine hydrolase domain-containing protein [Ponticaulis koreensis]